MADEAESPDTFELTDRDIRMACIRAAIDIHTFTGGASPTEIIASATQILNFINGSAQ